jgi:hypothetical protein
MRLNADICDGKVLFIKVYPTSAFLNSVPDLGEATGAVTPGPPRDTHRIYGFYYVYFSKITIN